MSRDNWPKILLLASALAWLPVQAAHAVTATPPAATVVKVAEPPSQKTQFAFCSESVYTEQTTQTC